MKLCLIPVKRLYFEMNITIYERSIFLLKERHSEKYYLKRKIVILDVTIEGVILTRHERMIYNYCASFFSKKASFDLPIHKNCEDFHLNFDGKS